MIRSIHIQWRKVVFLFALALFATGGLTPLQAQTQPQNGRYTAQEIVDSGHRFFGDAAGSMATAIENVFSKYGLPNGYILGEEGSGAIIGGLTYGEGTLYTKNEIGRAHV